MSTAQQTITILMIGDLVGKPGRALFSTHIGRLRAQYAPDCVVVNGENSAGNGRGITAGIVEFLLKSGADVITSGNHIFGQKGYTAAFAASDRLLRPLNFPSECPGKGYVLFTTLSGITLAVVNAQGRVFMHEQLACPFKGIESLLTYLKTQTKLIFLDFHAETTSEKQGMGFFLDGKITAQVGTHTHVQTADERVLPKGTGYITDLGCCASQNSMLGMNIHSVLSRMITQLPSKFEVEENGPFALHGVVIKAEVATGKTISIERIKIIEPNLIINHETTGKE
ncbi:MAG: 2,3-cyclic-nucleotide 2-phosphodiesterase [Candidatus Dependentiae bacterium]|nr:2,3-cyclic-nucleotide 2-phosphodiesterase [Candidatus Dependentiae bacterium]